MIIHKNVEQRSFEWFNLRLGKVTGSRCKAVFSANNLPLIDELIAEILTGTIEENYTSAAMQYGIDTEPEAKKEFEMLFNVQISEYGFCEHDTIKGIGLSPDGFFNSDTEAVEIKCPSPKKHVEYLRTKKIPAEYKYQFYMYFLICETLEKLHFISYCPRIETKKMHIVTIERNEILTDLIEFEFELKKFLTKLDKYYSEIAF